MSRRLELRLRAWGSVVTRNAPALGFAALLLVSLASCQSASGDVDKADQAAIGQDSMADVAAMVDAFNARDAERAVRSNAFDFIGMFHGQPNADHSTNLANVRMQVAGPALALTIDDEEVAVARLGDMAVYSNHYRYTFTNPNTGKPTVEHGDWVLVFRRQSDGTMKIYREIVSDLPANS